MKTDGDSTRAAPLVSVCFITYQHGRFVRQALESVLAQTCSFPVEICIGEDDSTDGTREVCQEFAGRDRRIRLFLRRRDDPKRSACAHPATYNALETLRACRGKYIALLEGDDYWTDPRKLEFQVRFLEYHPRYSCCTTYNRVVDADGKLLHGGSRIRLPFRSYLHDLAKGCVMHAATCSCLFRRAMLHLEDSAWMEQVIFCDRALRCQALLGGPFFVLPYVMASYRSHPGGITKCVSRIESARILLNDGRVLARRLMGHDPHLAAQRLKHASAPFRPRYLAWPGNALWLLRSVLQMHSCRRELREARLPTS